MNIAIVPTSEHHAEGFHACLDAVARERKFLARFEAPPLERIKGVLRDSVTSGASQFLALDGTQVVGWCDIFPHGQPATRHCGSLGIGLLPSHRGLSIGQRLMSTCILEAQGKGITRVELEVRADNAQAVKLYQRMGFVHEATKRRGMRFEGTYHDTWLMGLLLAEPHST